VTLWRMKALFWHAFWRVRKRALALVVGAWQLAREAAFVVVAGAVITVSTFVITGAYLCFVATLATAHFFEALRRRVFRGTYPAL
jgi:hypothetical protein